jgi:RNA polymerase sigma factor (sigma-70 family)
MAAMDSTSLSLIEGYAREPNDPRYAERFDAIYRPFIANCLSAVAKSQPAIRNDLDDLTQNILELIRRKLPGFHREGSGAFRSWVRRFAQNCVRNALKRAHTRGRLAGEFADQPDPTDELAKLIDAEHDLHVLRTLLSMLESPDDRRLADALRRGLGDDEIARQERLSVNAVRVRKTRLLHRLRAMSRGLVEDFSPFQ